MAKRKTGDKATAEKKKPAAKKAAGGARKKRGAAEAGSRGLGAAEVAGAAAPPEVAARGERVRADGGAPLCAYQDPLGGHWQLLVSLPLEKVQPTPFQRDLSDPHVKRLSDAIGGLDRFLDPVIVVRGPEGVYWTPNGNHRRASLLRLGAKSITALLLPDERVAYRILALNTEKAHGLREKALEVIRMARSLAELAPGEAEGRYSLEFEEPALITLGACYEQKGRFAGSSYQPVLKRVEAFLEEPLPAALGRRAARAELLFKVDGAVDVAVQALKARGLQSPYLKAFVVARVNPLKDEAPPQGVEDVLLEMLKRAQAFDPDKVQLGQIAGAAGPPGGGEE